MGGSETMVEKERALPGRPSEMPVSDKHFVLGTPMKGPWPAGFKVAVFGNGCFWGSEKGIWRLPGGGIHSTAIGYAAGYTPNPTYEEVCSGRTGHTEAVQVVYDPSKISFVDILRWFWEAHDPTAGMGQGNDRGTQYRSGFYWTDDEQRQLIEASAAAYEAALSKKAGKPRNITTEMKAASEFDTIFYYGEDYHRARLAPPPDVARYGCSCDPLCRALVALRVMRRAIPRQAGSTAVLLGAAPSGLASTFRAVGARLTQGHTRPQTARCLLDETWANAPLRDPLAERADRLGQLVMSCKARSTMTHELNLAKSCLHELTVQPSQPIRRRGLRRNAA
jgi:peptide-methionine (S)-S-oxide reductase